MRETDSIAVMRAWAEGIVAKHGQTEGCPYACSARLCDSNWPCDANTAAQMLLAVLDMDRDLALCYQAAECMLPHLPQ